MIHAAIRGKGNLELANYLTDKGENEEVVILPARGVVATDLRSQLRELVARAARGRTPHPVLHIHVDPAVEWTEDQYCRYQELYEAEFDLAWQPRLAVCHRKNGRAHRHYVWSIVRPDGRVISTAHDYLRREKISRILEYEFGEPHIAGRHNHAVAVALRQEGRLDVVASMEALGLLAVERPLARQSSVRRKQESRTGVDQEAIDSVVLTTWQSTEDGPGFEQALQAKGLTLAMGAEVPVLVDRTGSVHSLAQSLGRVSSFAGNRRVRAADVRSRLAGTTLRSLADVRLEVRVGAFLTGVGREMALMTSEPRADQWLAWPVLGMLTQEMAQFIRAAAGMMAADGVPSDDFAMEGVGADTPAIEMLLNNATGFLLREEGKSAAPQVRDTAEAEDRMAVHQPAMVPGEDAASEEERENVESTNWSGAGVRADNNAEGAGDALWREDVPPDSQRYRAYRQANGSAGRTSAEQPASETEPGGEEIFGPTGPDPA